MDRIFRGSRGKICQQKTIVTTSHFPDPIESMYEYICLHSLDVYDKFCSVNIQNMAKTSSRKVSMAMINLRAKVVLAPSNVKNFAIRSPDGGNHVGVYLKN